MMEQQEQEKNDLLQEKEKKIRLEHRLLRRKMVLMITAGATLLVVLFSIGYAWYTRVANIYAVTFDVADYDLSVNKNVDDKFLLNVYEYAEVTNKKMAPGTIGWIPLEISAEYSQVDVSYKIALETQMITALSNHFRFFVLKETDETVAAAEEDLEEGETLSFAAGDYHFGEALEETKDIADYEIEELKDINDIVTGTIGQGKKETLCIYWEWYYDAATAGAAGVKFKTTKDATDANSLWTALAAARQTEISQEWDELDTDIGRYPRKYLELMDLYIYTSGAQIIPKNGKVPTTEAESSSAPSSSEPSVAPSSTP